MLTGDENIAQVDCAHFEKAFTIEAKQIDE